MKILDWLKTFNFDFLTANATSRTNWLVVVALLILWKAGVDKQQLYDLAKAALLIRMGDMAVGGAIRTYNETPEEVKK